MADLESVANELYSNGNRVFVEGDSIDADTLDGVYLDDIVASNEGMNVSATDGSDYTGVVKEGNLMKMVNGQGSINYPEEYGVTWTFNKIDNRTISLWFALDGSLMAIQKVDDDLTTSGWYTFTPDTVGEIKLYTGKVVDIPKGWNIANGTKGTVDMSADFKTYGTDEVVYIQYTGGN